MTAFLMAWAWRSKYPIPVAITARPMSSVSTAPIQKYDTTSIPNAPLLLVSVKNDRAREANVQARMIRRAEAAAECRDVDRYRPHAPKHECQMTMKTIASATFLMVRRTV